MNVTLRFMQNFAYLPLCKTGIYPQFLQESGQESILYALLGLCSHDAKFNAIVS